MKKIFLLFEFYKTYAFASLLITASCLSILYRWGMGTFFALFLFKLITLALFYYFICEFKKNDFFYYKNLGLAKLQLWVFTITFDMFLYLTLVSIVMKLR